MDNKFTPNENNLRNIQELIDWSFERIAKRYGSFSPMHIKGCAHLMHWEVNVLADLRKGILPSIRNYTKEINYFMSNNYMALNNEYDGAKPVFDHHKRILESGIKEETIND